MGKWIQYCDVFINMDTVRMIAKKDDKPCFYFGNTETEQHIVFHEPWDKFMNTFKYVLDSIEIEETANENSEVADAPVPSLVVREHTASE